MRFAEVSIILISHESWSNMKFLALIFLVSCASQPVLTLDYKNMGEGYFVVTSYQKDPVELAKYAGVVCKTFGYNGYTVTALKEERNQLNAVITCQNIYGNQVEI